jgi:hypothetical protein
MKSRQKNKVTNTSISSSRRKSYRRKNIESNCPSYSKNDLVQIAIKNGYSASESIHTSKSKLCSILNPPSIPLENEIMPKVCGPSKSIKFPNVYSRDELIHSLIDKGYLPEIVSRMSTKHLCYELGIEGKHINEDKEKIPNSISMTKRTCSPKKYGGYSKDELVKIAVLSGYKKSDATKSNIKDLCKLFKIPYQDNKSPSPSLSQNNISAPIIQSPSFKNEKVNYYIDDSNSCSLYSREGETFCNSLVDKKSGQEVCKFDTYNNKCGIKLRIQSDSVLEEKKLSQLENLINESYLTFDIKLRQLLEQRYSNFESHQISKAVEEIKNQNVASFNNQFVEFVKNIISTSPVLSLADKNNIDNWILQYAYNLVNEYEIKLSRDMLETEKKNSLEASISKQKEEIEHKIEHIEELKNIEQEEGKEEEIKNIIKEEEKEIEQMVEEIENKEQKIDEIKSKIYEIKHYYKEKGQIIDIDESSIESNKEHKIKLEATIYNPIETMYKNYIDNSSYLKNMEAKHAILEKNLKLAYRLIDRLRSEISSDSNKNPLLDNSIEEKIKLESEITSLNKRMLLLQDEMKDQLLKINKYEQYNPKHINHKLSQITSNNNIIKGKKLNNTTLDNLYNSISN